MLLHIGKLAKHLQSHLSAWDKTIDIYDKRLIYKRVNILWTKIVEEDEVMLYGSVA